MDSLMHSVYAFLAAPGPGDAARTRGPSRRSSRPRVSQSHHRLARQRRRAGGARRSADRLTRFKAISSRHRLLSLRNKRITDQAIMSDQDRNSNLGRRRSKILQFIIAEVSAIGVLLLVGSFAVLSRWGDSTLAFSINILTIVAAAAVAIIDRKSVV